MSLSSSPELPNLESEPAFITELLSFCEELRENDFTITPAEIIQAARIVAMFDFSSIDDLRDGLKVTLAKKPEDYLKFDELFRKFWIVNQGRISPNLVNPLGRLVRASQQTQKFRTKKSSNQEQKFKDQSGPQGRIISPKAPNLEKNLQSDKLERSLYAVYSPIETMGSKTLSSSVDIRERATIKRNLRLFSRRMATRSGRRFETSNVGTIDFRKTMRDSLKTGYPNDVFRSEKKISRSRLLFLIDISGSMDAYANPMIKLAYFASNTISGTSVLGFSTDIVSLGPYLEGRTLREATDLVTNHVRIWSSGTKMGAALSELITKYPQSLRKSSVLVMVSDGWEIGDLELLKAKLNEIRKRIDRIVWINPHADSADYRPEASGIKVALPFIDYFAGLDVFTNKSKFLRVFGRSFQGQQFHLKPSMLRTPSLLSESNN
jgi:uncharacterized protein